MGGAFADGAEALHAIAGGRGRRGSCGIDAEGAGAGEVVLAAVAGDEVAVALEGEVEDVAGRFEAALLQVDVGMGGGLLL